MADDTGSGAAPAHVSGVQRGEDVLADDGKEPGRRDVASDDTPAGRPAGTSTGRDATGIDPQGTKDPASPPNG